MDRTRLPFMQFYPADGIQDTQIMTAVSKAAWIDLLCQMWISPTPGTITWNRLSFTTYLRLEYDEEIELVVAELSRVGDLELLDSSNNPVDKFENCTWIIVTSRRMLRDIERLNKRKKTHKEYNDKRTTRKRQQNDRETTGRSQKSEVRSQISEVRSHTSEEEGKKTKSAKAPLVLPDWLDAKVWGDYAEMRTKLRRPMTARAQELALERLTALRESGEDARAVVEQSILNSWLSLYAIRSDNGRQKEGELSERTKRILRRGL
jgi:hypothetical protein